MLQRCCFHIPVLMFSGCLTYSTTARLGVVRVWSRLVKTLVVLLLSHAWCLVGWHYYHPLSPPGCWCWAVVCYCIVVDVFQVCGLARVWSSSVVCTVTNRHFLHFGDHFPVLSILSMNPCIWAIMVAWIDSSAPALEVVSVFGVSCCAGGVGAAASSSCCCGLLELLFLICPHCLGVAGCFAWFVLQDDFLGGIFVAWCGVAWRGVLT